MPIGSDCSGMIKRPVLNIQFFCIPSYNIAL